MTKQITIIPPSATQRLPLLLFLVLVAWSSLVANDVKAFVVVVVPSSSSRHERGQGVTAAVSRPHHFVVPRHRSQAPAVMRPATAHEEGEAAAGQTEEAKEEEEDTTTTVYYKILSEAGPATAGGKGPNNAAAAPSESEASESASSASYYYYDHPTLNGWSPREDYALWGLPGAIAPLGYFDPIGFCRRGTTLNDAKRLREAEVQHGRVAMLAVVGYLVGEVVVAPHGPFGLYGPANDQLQQVPPLPFAVLTACIAIAELYRAHKGWVEPALGDGLTSVGSGTLWTLRSTYYPGDIGFDPLGLKPDENYAFQAMQTKELSHGRLAMIGWAGMCAQELVTHQTIGETWGIFYRNVFV